MKVVSFSPLWREELAARLQDGIALVTVDPSEGSPTRTDLADAQILLTTRFDAQLAAACGALQLIICPAAGTEGIDRDAVPEGVPIVNGIGHEIPMAEYVIGALVALRQRFQQADGALRKGEWRFGFFGSRETVDELNGSTMGIIGFGHIGEHVALRAGTFGVSCHAVTLHPGKPIEPGLLSAPPGRIDGGRDVDALVASSDAVVVACEHSPLTHGLVDARRLGMMRRSAVLINVARGPIVDEGALFDALERKLIAGAAIDVWYRYPENRASKVTPSTYPFERLDNVLMTPHSSGWTPGAKERKVAFLAKTINDWYASHAVGKV